MAMNYFRRPALAGHNLVRTTNAVVRGSVRRSNPDGTSAEPYFPDLNIGDTLLVDIDDTGATSVVFTGVDLQTVLDDINATLSGCIAFDSDGCVAIVTDTPGSLGSVSVSGGTGVEALGFDVVSSGSVLAYGGEIASTPEGRIGNPFGVAFPNKGENFTTESLNRVASRLSSNSDVLFSELARERVVVQKVGSTTNGASEGKFQAVTAPLFTGLGLLSRTSTRAQLSSFFFLYDSTTGLPAASRVTAVVKGTPGSYPTPGGGYANTASWGANDGGNVLGMDLVKVSAQAITEVRQGRVVVVPTANFTTSNVRAGDLVNITGATNASPFSHNGYQWVVESVLSATALSLRPMSKAEIVLTGNNAQDSVQPIVELNGEFTGTFGSITVRTGTFMHGLTLVLEPPVPPNATYEIWAASPTNFRDDGVTQGRQALDELRNLSSSSFLTSDFDPVTTQLLSGFALTTANLGVDLQVAAGKIRWRGRVVNIPARIWSNNGTEIPNGVSYLYFDEVEGKLKVSATAGNWTSYFDETSSNRGLLLARLTAVTSTSVTIESAVRLGSEKPKMLTVGRGGQFSSLPEAIRYANVWGSATSETTTATGDYAHWDIVLLSDQTLAADLSITAAGVSIRGANPLTTLTFNACKITIPSGGGQFRMSDLTLTTTGSMVNVPLISCTVACKFFFNNVRQTGGSFSVVLITTASVACPVVGTDCTFILSRGILWTTASSNGANFTRCSFTYSLDGSYTTPTMLSNNAGTGTWFGACSFYYCTFTSWTTTSTTQPYFGTLSVGPTTSPGAVIQGCYFNNGSFAADQDAILMSSSADLWVDQCNINSVPRAVVGTSSVLVTNSKITVRPQSSAAIGIVCGKAIGNIISVSTPSTPGNEGIALEVISEAIGNTISGGRVGIQSLSADSLFNTIEGNDISISYAGGYAVTVNAIGILSTSPVTCIANNTIRIGTKTSTSSIGISFTGSTRASVVGNTITTFGSPPASYTSISCQAPQVCITGNTTNGKMAVLDGGVASTINIDTSIFTDITATITAASSVTFSDCSFSGTVAFGSFTSTSSEIMISGCTFTSTFTWSGGDPYITISNSRFVGAAAFSPGVGGNGNVTIVGSHFIGALSCPALALRDLSISTCTFESDFSVLSGTLLVDNCLFPGFVSSTDLLFKTSSTTHIRNCYFSLAQRVLLQSTSSLSGSFTNNYSPRVRLDTNVIGFVISGNTFNSISLGASSNLPLSIKRATNSFAGEPVLSIIGNFFTIVNGIIAGTTVQTPCVQLGDSNLDTFDSVIVEGNSMYMLTRTSNSGAITVGCLQVEGICLAASVIGNHFVRTPDANSVTGLGVNFKDASNTNTLYSANHSYNTSGTIAYSVDTKAKGALSFTASGATTLI